MMPFDSAYKIAQDREDELRKAIYVDRGAQRTRARQHTLQGRLAGLLRGVADRLDPAQGLGGTFSKKGFAE